jgi:hypothetical protein
MRRLDSRIIILDNLEFKDQFKYFIGFCVLVVEKGFRGSISDIDFVNYERIMYEDFGEKMEEISDDYSGDGLLFIYNLGDETFKQGAKSYFHFSRLIQKCILDERYLIITVRDSLKSWKEYLYFTLEKEGILEHRIERLLKDLSRIICKENLYETT